MLDTNELIDYEMSSSIWPTFIGWGWGQDLVAKMFVNKVVRKKNRYARMQEAKIKLQAQNVGSPA